MTKKRKTKRKPLNLFLPVVDRKTRQLLGYVGDLTPEGAMLVSEKEFLPQEILHLVIDMPENFDSDHLNLTSRVIWSEKEPDSGLFETGVLFNDLNAEDDGFINRLLLEFV